MDDDPGADWWPDEAEYLAYLEAERRMFAWCLIRLGSYLPEDAAREALVRYPYEAPDTPYRGILFHDLAWKVALRHLYGNDITRRLPEVEVAWQEYERESWRLHGVG